MLLAFGFFLYLTICYANKENKLHLAYLSAAAILFAMFMPSIALEVMPPA